MEVLPLGVMPRASMLVTSGVVSVPLGIAAGHDLIAAAVNIFAGKYGHGLGQDIFQERHRSRSAQAVKVNAIQGLDAIIVHGVIAAGFAACELSGYAYRPASEWQGISISGTTVMCRSAA